MTAIHSSSIEAEEMFPASPVRRPVKKRVKFHDIRASVSIGGAIPTFIVTILVVKRFIALEDYSAYADRMDPRKTCSLDAHESLERLATAVTYDTLA